MKVNNNQVAISLTRALLFDAIAWLDPVSGPLDIEINDSGTDFLSMDRRW